MKTPVGACVVIAEFEVKPAAFGDFVALARRLAQECLADRLAVVANENPVNIWRYENRLFLDVACDLRVDVPRQIQNDLRFVQNVLVHISLLPSQNW